MVSSQSIMALPPDAGTGLLWNEMIMPADASYYTHP